MRIMAVDLGDARTGIAISDSSEMLATPYRLITEKKAEEIAAGVVTSAAEAGAGMLVVGLPVNMDGSEGVRAQKSRSFAQLLEERTDLPIVLWDERGSTKTATQYMNQGDVRGKKRKQQIDAAAATVILQSYLDYRKNSRGG